jgi:nitrogen regulatory protein P-II 1
MIKVEAIVREDKYEDVKDALDVINVNGMTISQVMGCGVQKGYNEAVRDTKDDINVLPKIKFEIIVSSQEQADKIVDVICKSAYTGNCGDGKILVYEIKDAIRIRTGEHGEQAI